MPKEKKPRQLKCQVCGEKDIKENMEAYEKPQPNGKVLREYCHKGECWDKYIKDRTFKDKENKELDSLYQVIKSIHKMDIIPHTFFSGYLQPVRNGNFKLGKRVVRKKEGYPFPIIEKAYNLAKPNILYAKKNGYGDIEKSALSELRYCFAIVIDKLPLAMKQMKQDEREQVIAKELSEATSQSDVVHANTEVKFKKKKVHRDMTQFLD